MNAKYFNRWEFEQAYSLIKINPMEARLAYEEYFRKYPQDYCAYSYYIYVLSVLGEFSKAEEVLNNVKIMANSDSNFSMQFEKFKIFRHDIVLSGLRLLANQGKYEELYQYYLENSYILEEDDLSYVIFYCKHKLGLLEDDEIGMGTYIFRQVLDYHESDFMDHIKKHMADYNINAAVPCNSIFVSDFPIDDMVREVKKYIPSDKKLCTGFYENKYVFKYDRCGRCDDKAVDYFKVTCFADNNRLITMFPSNCCEYLPCVDLNYMTPEKGKVKCLSQIDKFNRKWGR